MGKVKQFFVDFKNFIAKGNIFDMAVGVIIGSAFSPIVSSLVNDIIMPPLGLLIGGKDFTQFKAVLKEAVVDTDGTILKEAVTINYGNFISIILNFLLIAFIIFLVVRIITKSQKHIQALQEKAKAKGQPEVVEEPEAPAEPVETQEDILRDIRDLLAKSNKE